MQQHTGGGPTHCGLPAIHVRGGLWTCARPDCPATGTWARLVEEWVLAA